jgi:hypothetical protein
LKGEKLFLNLPAPPTTTIWYACNVEGLKNFTMPKSKNGKPGLPKIVVSSSMNTRYRFMRIVPSPRARIEKPRTGESPKEAEPAFPFFDSDGSPAGGSKNTSLA